MKIHSKSFLLSAVCLLGVCHSLQADTSAAKAPDGAADQQKVTKPFETVTKFIGPLRKHDANLEKIGKEISRLLNADKPGDPKEGKKREEDIEAVGKEFLKEGKAFLNTITGFLRAETRRGLMMEIDLIQTNVSAAHKMLLDYRRLKGVKIADVTKIDRADLKELLSRFAMAQARKRIAARLDDEGLRKIVTDEAWCEAEKKAVAIVKETIGVDVGTRTGEFHDRRSLLRTLKRGVDRSLERRITRLMVKITGNEIIIALGQEIIGTWVRDKMWNVVWPRIKERFRRKGLHASRTKRSIATMRAARIRLGSLSKDTRRDRVIHEMNQAIETVLATHYLIKDLRRGKKVEKKKGEEEREARPEDKRDKLYKALVLEIATLRRTRKNTGLRFLLHKESLVMALLVDREVLVDTLRELEKILRGVEPPNPMEGKIFFYSPYQVPAEFGAKPNPAKLRASLCYLEFSNGTLRYLDVEAMEKYRKVLRKRYPAEVELPVEEFARKNVRVTKDYGKPYIVRLTYNGRTRYMHYTGNLGGYHGVWGYGKFFGLRPGRHAVTVRITTSEGFPLDATLTFRVKFKKGTMTWVRASLERRVKAVKASRALLAELKDKGEGNVREAARTYQRNIGHFLELQSKYGSSPATVMIYLREKMATSEFLLLLAGERPEPRDIDAYVSTMKGIAHWCQEVATSDAYALAKEALGKAMGQAGHFGKLQKRQIAAMHRHLAHLAISTGDNVKAAVAHLENYLLWEKKAGVKVDEEAERKTWPTPIVTDTIPVLDI